MSTVEGFGEPKHGSDRKGFPESLKDGVQEHRILPPILSQVETGKYVRDHTCHYGYGTKMNNSDKEFPNPFYCVEEGKFIAGKFVVLQDCPECQEIKRIQNEKAAIEAGMKAEGKQDVEIAAATESLVKWLRKHNRDFKFYVNVKDAAGRYFTVKYPSKNVWKVIMAAIDKYKSQRIPIDAIAASQGLWFRITRSGKGFKTEYTAEVVTEDVLVNGQIVEGAQKPKLGPLSAEDARKARESCLDLGDVGIRRLSREQVARLVASKGDPNIIQAIFASSDPTSQITDPREDTSQDSEGVTSEAASVAAVSVTAPVAATAPAVKAPAPTSTSLPVTAPSAIQSQADLLARARALMEQARGLGPLPTAPVVAAPAPVLTSAPEVKVPAAVTPAPAPAPVAASSNATEAEAAFLKQFDFSS